MTSRKDIEQLIKRINATPGFVVPEDRTSSCHRRAFRADADGNPVGRGVTLPGTPGDHNQLHTTRRKLRRNLGWHDPLATVNTHRGKKKKRRKDGANDMVKLSEAARLVPFSDGTAAPAVKAAGASTAPAASTSSRPPAPPSTPSTAAGAPTRPPLTTGTVREAARYMWWHLRTKAAQNPDGRTTHKGVAGWQFTGRLGDEIKEVYPELAGLDADQFKYLLNRVRSVLSEDGRLISLKPGNPVVPSVYFVRDQATEPIKTSTAVTPAPAVAPAQTASPADVVSTGPQTAAKDNTERGDTGEVKSAATDPTRATPLKNSARVTAEDLLGFLGDHETLLAERAEIEDFAVRVADMSQQLNRAATALLERLRGRDDGSS